MHRLESDFQAAMLEFTGFRAADEYRTTTTVWFVTDRLCVHGRSEVGMEIERPLPYEFPVHRSLATDPSLPTPSIVPIKHTRSALISG